MAVSREDSSCDTRASHCSGFSYCGAWAQVCISSNSCSSWALEHRPSSWGTRAWLPHSMWDLPGQGIEPVSSLWTGRFFTIQPSGKPKLVYFESKTIIGSDTIPNLTLYSNFFQFPGLYINLKKSSCKRFLNAPLILYDYSPQTEARC